MLTVSVACLTRLSTPFLKDKKKASRSRQRAELIVDYYDVMGEEDRKTIEESIRWIHKLVPELLLGRGQGDDEAWQGRVFAIRDAIEKEITEQVSGLDEKIIRLTEETRNAGLNKTSVEEKFQALEDNIEKKTKELNDKLGKILSLLGSGHRRAVSTSL